MKHVLALAALALCAGCASHEPNPDAAKSNVAEDTTCVRDTGSRLPRTEGKCVPEAGHTYSQDELNRTGHPDIGHALGTVLTR